MRVFILFCLAVGAFGTSVVTEERPGSCPSVVPDTENEYGVCPRECVNDDGCQEESQKCCQSSCGGMKCVSAEFPETEEEKENKTRQEITQLLTAILSERRDLVEKLDKYPPPLARFIKMKNRTDVVRMCVKSPCEMRKCQRIAQAMTYKVTPRKEWFCQMATSTEQCLFWAERGWTDTVMARENKIFIAKDKFNVTAFAYEKKNDAATEIEKKVQNITLVVKMADSNIETFSQLSGRKVCSAGVNQSASFLTPVCNLIYKDIMLKTGNLVESATDFFEEMCVPGIMNKTYNKNETFPKNLVSGCQNEEDKYSGYIGSIKCVKAGYGDVAFVDQKVVKHMNEIYPDVFKLVCEDESLPLTEWEHTKCHLGYTPRPVLFVNPERDVEYKDELKEIIKEAAKIKTSSVNLFDSSDYVCLKQPNKDLIFMDENTNLEFVDQPLAIPAVQDYLQTFNVCQALPSKPRAKICTVGKEEYEKCLTLKSVFQKDDDLKNMSWGCVLAKTKMDCMRNVLNGTADLYSGDVKEIFIGGNDFKLKPIMILDEEETRSGSSQLYNVTVKSHTIAIMKKSRMWTKFGQDTKMVNVRNLTVCTPDMKKVPNFHLPIGYMLSTGVMPRIGSVFESMNKFYKSACVPGASPVEFKWDSDLILGHEVNWGIPGLSFYNFTGFDWFIWNSPHTWTFYNYNRKTPGTIKNFMQKRLLVPLLEGKLTVPEEFDPETFDYTILDDVLSVEGLGDIFNDIPDKIRDSLIDIKEKKVDRKERFRELYEEKTGDEFISLRDRGVAKLTLRGFLEKSFQNMEDEWGIFDDVNRPVLAPKKPGLTKTGGKVSNFRDILESVDAGDNKALGNLLKDYDSDYTVPVIANIFAKMLKEKFDTLSGMAKTLEILHRVPAMTSVTGEDYEWMKHPSVQAYLKIYAPRLVSFYSDLYDNVEVSKIQHSRYLKPLWLSPKFKEFLDITKLHMTELTESCRGYGDRKGLGNDLEPFFDNKGALTCIQDTEKGDIAFVDTKSIIEEFKKQTVKDIAGSIKDYVMITPVGIVQDINNETILNGSFGFTPFPAIMTAFNKTGSWRWNVTKALLIAQKKYSAEKYSAGEVDYKIFGENCVFKQKTKKIVPIPLHMQSYATYLRPKLTRALEAIIKPSTFDWWKERRHICSGEQFTNVITQKNGTCTAEIKDVTCTGMPRPKVISVGTTENKQPVVVKMCSRPTRFIREMAEFTCDNGHGYVTPVMIPTTCQCVPCDEIEYIPKWTKDRMWSVEERKFIVTEPLETMYQLWGNEEFWIDHSLNDNFEIGTDPENVESEPIPVIKPVGSCEANWYGKWWNPEWYPDTNKPVCLGTMTGLRRVLTSERLQSKLP